jgi:ATP-dependent Lhr-like helicase
VLAVESFTPSPVAQSLLWNFSSIYLYEGDTPKAERQLQTLSLSRELLQDLLRDVALDELLRPEAVQEIRARLQHTAPTSQARTVEELGVLFQEMGDLSSLEIARRSQLDPANWLAQLAGQGRILEMSIPTAGGPERRWVAAEYAPEYRAAFSMSEDSEGAGEAAQAQSRILERFLRHAGPVTLEEIQRRYLFPIDWLRNELYHLVESRQVAHGRFTPDQALDKQAAFSVDEFIDLHTLEQIHRRTLGILRREVRAVPFTAYADFLAEWQHLAPEHHWSGPGALRQALQQLRAAPVVGQTWERDVLPLRLARYDPAELEALCQSGEVIWVGSGGADPRRGRTRFLFRGEGGLFLEPAPEDLSGLSSAPQAVYNLLKSEGAVFFADIQASLDMKDSEVEASLIELVMAGLVTNDGLDGMRRIVTHRGVTNAAQPQDQVPFSSLEEQLAERLRGRERRLPSGVRRPRPAEYRAAKRRVRERLGMDAEPSQAWVGRWTLVHRFGVMGKPVPPEERAAQQARQLLLRHAILTRDSLAREEGAWDWSLIYQQLKRMEMRGEVRRGYFVQGLPGVQFALPEVVERLRAVASGALTDENQPLVVMNACDPANLYGPALDTFDPTQQPPQPTSTGGQPPTFSRIPSTWLVQHRGLPVLVAEDTGVRITTGQGTDEAMIRRALLTLLGHLSRFQHRVTVEMWNGMPVLDSAGRSVLESLNFYRDYPGMTWERQP